MGDEPFLPVDGYLSTELPSVHFLHDALHEGQCFQSLQEEERMEWG